MFVEKSSAFGSYLDISESGLPQRGDRDSADQVVEYQAFSNGFAIIRLESYVGNFGDDTFTITVQDQLSFPTLPINQPLVRQSIHPGQVHWYQVSVTPGQQLYVFVEKSSAFGSYLDISENGLPQRGDRDSADQELRHDALSAGNVIIRLESYVGNFGDDTFTITVTSPEVPDSTDHSPPAIVIETPSDGQIVEGIVVLTASGTAVDNVAVVSVTVNGVDIGIRAGATVNWQADLALAEGENSISVVATDSAGNVTTESLTVSYTPPSPAEMQLDVALLRVGSAALGASATAQITVSNVGGSPLTISGITADSPVFSASPRSFTIAPGTGQQVDVTFQPYRVGWEVGSLSIAHDGVNSLDEIALDGIGSMDPPVGALEDTMIAFSSNRDGNDEIYVMDSDGSNSRNLTQNPATDWKPSWSPDGRHIAFTSNRVGNNDVFVMNADGSNPRQLTRHSSFDTHADWSPDGKSIVFQSDRDGNWEAYVIDVDGSALRRLTDDPSHNGHPVWAPDGSRLLYTGGSRWDIFMMDPDGLNPINLTRHTASDWHPAWSPAGGLIAFESDRSGNVDVYVAPADGSEPRNLTSNPATDGGPRFSPDGSRVVFHSDRIGERDIYTVGVEDGTLRRLTTDPAADSWPAWSPFLDPTVDRTQPVLVITSPEDGYTSAEASVTISGTASDDVAVQSVAINGEAVTITAGAAVAWQHLVVLAEGIHELLVVAVDSSGNKATESLSVSIAVANHAPAFTQMPVRPASEGVAMTFVVSATDPDDDELDYAAPSIPSGASFNASNGRFRWTPDFAQSGEHAVVFTVTDGTVSVTQTVSVVVASTDVLSVAGPSVITGKENENLTATVTVASSAVDKVSLGVEGLPERAEFRADTGVFTFVPDYTQSGAYEVVVIASQAGEEVERETLSIVVDDASPLIAISPPNRTIPEGETLTVSAGFVADAGDGLTLSIDGMPERGSLDVERGVFEFSPGFHQSGEYTVRLTAMQDGEAVGSAELSIVVEDVSVLDIEAPAVNVAEGEEATVRVVVAEQALSVTLAAGSLPENATLDAVKGVVTFTPDYTQAGVHTLTVVALEGDQEVERASADVVVEDALPIVVAPSSIPSVNEGDTLTIRVTAAHVGPDIRVDPLPRNVTFDSATGRVVFQPDYTQAGTHDLPLIATQNGEVVERRTVRIEVNNTPVMVLDPAGPVTLSEGRALAISASVIESAQVDVFIEVDFAGLSASYSDEEGELRLAPGFTEAGVHTVIVRAVAGEQIVERAEITVTVLDTPALTVTPSEPLRVAEGNLVDATATLAPEAIGRAVLTLVSSPDNAALDRDSGLFTFAPGYTQQGVHEAKIGVSQDGEIVDSHTVRIVVENVDVLSTASAPIRQVPEGEALTIEFDLLDEVAGAITLAADALPANSSFNAPTGDISFRPDYSQAGSYEFTVLALQGSSVVETETVSVTVTHVNLPPTVTLDGPDDDVAGDVAIGFEISDFDEDPVSLAVDYRVGEVGDWETATLASTVTGTRAYEGSLTWVSREDIPSTSGSEVMLRVTPSDGGDGVATIADPFRLVNYLGDYDDDRLVGFEDLVQFEQAWKAQDISRDIGPAVGDVPDLQLVQVRGADLAIDFEDLTTFVRMWNWFAAQAPLPVPEMITVPTSSVALSYYARPSGNGWSTRHVDVAAPFDSSAQAARLTLAYDAESVSVLVSDDTEPDVILLTRRNVDAGLMEVQIAWLNTRSDGDPVVSLDLTTLRPGDTDIRIAFDIRDAAGRSYRGLDVLPLRFEAPPTTTRLLPNYPNPFNPETWIPFDLAEVADVAIHIYDARGILVRTLDLGRLPARTYHTRDKAAYWNGRNALGESVASGVYAYELEAGDHREMRRTVIRK